MDFSEVTDKMLLQVKVSKKEFQLMHELFKFDEDIFLNKEKVPSKSPHIFIVDVGKYGDKIP